jgi:hypothetical protein
VFHIRLDFAKAASKACQRTLNSRPKAEITVTQQIKGILHCESIEKLLLGIFFSFTVIHAQVHYSQIKLAVIELTIGFLAKEIESHEKQNHHHHNP